MQRALHVLSYFSHIFTHCDYTIRGVCFNFKMNEEKSCLIKGRITEACLRFDHVHPLFCIFSLNCWACCLLAAPGLCFSVISQPAAAAVTPAEILMWHFALSMRDISLTQLVDFLVNYVGFVSGERSVLNSSVAWMYLPFPQYFSAFFS